MRIKTRVNGEVRQKDTVESMMAQPRSSVKYTNVFPAADGWDYMNV